MLNTKLIPFANSLLEGQLVCVTASKPHSANIHKVDITIVTTIPLTPEKKQTFSHAFAALVHDTKHHIEIVYEQDLQMSLNGYGFVSKGGVIDTSMITPS